MSESYLMPPGQAKAMTEELVELDQMREGAAWWIKFGFGIAAVGLCSNLVLNRVAESAVHPSVLNAGFFVIEAAACAAAIIFGRGVLRRRLYKYRMWVLTNKFHEQLEKEVEHHLRLTDRDLKQMASSELQDENSSSGQVLAQMTARQVAAMTQARCGFLNAYEELADAVRLCEKKHLKMELLDRETHMFTHHQAGIQTLAEQPAELKNVQVYQITDGRALNVWFRIGPRATGAQPK